MHGAPIAYSRTLGSRTFEADALHHLGVVYFQSGQLAKARDCMEGALGEMREVGDVYRHARMLSTLLGVYAMSGDNLAAERILPELEDLLKVTPNPLVSGFTAQAKGLLALQQNKPEQARQLFKTAEAFGRNHQFREFLCLALSSRAALEPDPQPLLNEALELAVRHGFRLQEYHIRKQLNDKKANEVLAFLRSNTPEGWF